MEGKLEGGPLLEGLEGLEDLEEGHPREGVEGVPPLDGLEGGPPQAGAEGGSPQASEEDGPPHEGKGWAQEPDRAQGLESAQELESNVEPDGTPNSPPPL